MKNKNSLITAKNIYRHFGSGDLITNVLRGIDFSVYDGEFVAIMGKSGAGKSTFMYQLSLLDTPSKGEISIGDTDVLTLTEQEKTTFRLHTLGYIFQNYALVPDLSSRENCMVPLLMRGLNWQEAKEKAESSLTSVGLEHRFDSLPSTLSGGEQQRVSIARAVAGSPTILFADEPTANLDSVSGTQVIELLSDLHKKGQTIVMVTHEREYACSAERIIHMEDGKITKEEKLK
ncbi:MAG: ABC transporter ATP-binding protein [Candidatus Paceibacteria bacterium]